jgi:hypothetical protein
MYRLPGRQLSSAPESIDAPPATVLQVAQPQLDARHSLFQPALPLDARAIAEMHHVDVGLSFPGDSVRSGVEFRAMRQRNAVSCC